jgi:hypothetical protein
MVLIPRDSVELALDAIVMIHESAKFRRGDFTNTKEIKNGKNDAVEEIEMVSSGQDNDNEPPKRQTGLTF